MSRLKDRFFQNARKPRGILGRLMMIRMNFRHRQLHLWGLSFLKIKEDSRVLDIGCGGGSVLSILLKMVPNGFVEGIDYSETAASFAAARNRAAAGRCRVTVGDVGALPYRDNTFDTVTAFETVYFWPDLKRSLNGIRRVLKANGRFLLCCEAGNPAAPGNGVHIRGMKIYTADALCDFLEAAGFHAIEVHYGPYPGWFCILAKK